MKQAAWLVKEIDKAIKSAPQDCGGDEEQRKHWAERSYRARCVARKIGTLPDWENKNRARHSRIMHYICVAERKQLEAHGCITIPVPDGPEYTIINTKDTLREFKKRVALKYIENDAPPLKPTGYLPKQRTSPANIPTVAKQAPDKAKARKLVSQFAMDEKRAREGFRMLYTQTHCSEAGEIFATDGRAIGCVLGYADGEFDKLHTIPKTEYVDGKDQYTDETVDVPYCDTRQVVPAYREALPPNVKQVFDNHVTLRVVELFPHVYNCDMILTEDVLKTTLFFQNGDKLVCAAQDIPSVFRLTEHDGMDKYETGRPAGAPEFALNASYVLKVIKLFAGMGCDEFTVSWSSNIDPVVFCCERAYAVVMPVRFEGQYEPIKQLPRKRVLQKQD